MTLGTCLETCAPLADRHLGNAQLSGDCVAASALLREQDDLRSLDECVRRLPRSRQALKLFPCRSHDRKTLGSTRGHIANMHDEHAAWLPLRARWPQFRATKCDLRPHKPQQTYTTRYELGERRTSATGSL